MLVLSRKEEETIVIDGHIRIKVLAVHGKQVRVGIEAPPQIPVRRSELCDFSESLSCMHSKIDRGRTVDCVAD
jgi:carbon storage regulator